MTDRDAFDAIAAPTPAISADAAVAVVRERYGLDVSAEPLTSERDQNFRLTGADGRHYVLKIANAVEDPQVTRFQIAALDYIAEHRGAGLRVPEILPTQDGDSDFLLEIDGDEHITRLVSYLSGAPMSGVDLNTALCRSFGSQLACLARALEGFSHPGADQRLLWDMKRALELRELTPHLPVGPISTLIEATLDEFERYALPAFDALRWQVIHNDANPANVLVAEDGDAVTGIIDFGDMLNSPLIIDVAVAASYLRVQDGNPLSLIVEFLAGYHASLPLTRAETDLLHTLIKTRLATSVVILHWRESLRGADDAYLQDSAASESDAVSFLERLAEIPWANAAQIYAQVCASAANVPQPQL